MSVLGEQVADFAASHVIQQVGRGECTDLAIHALQAAGARSHYPSQNGMPVWGSTVPVAFAERGDILQFQTFVITIRNADGTGQRESRGHPNHTAIVLENLGNGAFRVAEQNMVYPGAGNMTRTVGTAVVFTTNQTTSDNRQVTVHGRVQAYRPQQ